MPNNSAMPYMAAIYTKHSLYGASSSTSSSSSSPADDSFSVSSPSLDCGELMAASSAYTCSCAVVLSSSTNFSITCTTSWWSSVCATSLAVRPSAALISNSSVCLCGGAFSSSACAACGRPWYALQCSAVQPSPSTAVTSAPAAITFWMNSVASTTEPHATMSAVHWSSCVAAFTELLTAHQSSSKSAFSPAPSTFSMASTGVSARIR
uniref:Uncharacterized protein n=1 Tax=Globisporangium ultimum (strain ATCC 200006 / CBS 805.95 / DAOM BR144) TaxID=431595 RepID=K3W9C9_GLOUD